MNAQQIEPSLNYWQNPCGMSLQTIHQLIQYSDSIPKRMVQESREDMMRRMAREKYMNAMIRLGKPSTAAEIAKESESSLTNFYRFVKFNTDILIMKRIKTGKRGHQGTTIYEFKDMNSATIRQLIGMSESQHKKQLYNGFDCKNQHDIYQIIKKHGVMTATDIRDSKEVNFHIDTIRKHCQDMVKQGKLIRTKRMIDNNRSMMAFDVPKGDK